MDHIIHRRFVAHSNAHYAGGLVDGAYLMRLFGEVATDLSLQISGDEGKLAAYEEVSFTAPLLVGEIVEVSGKIVSVGNRSRRIQFEARTVKKSSLHEHKTGGTDSGSLVVARALGVLVIPVVVDSRDLTVAE